MTTGEVTGQAPWTFQPGSDTSTTQHHRQHSGMPHQCTNLCRTAQLLVWEGRCRLMLWVIAVQHPLPRRPKTTFLGRLGGHQGGP